MRANELELLRANGAEPSLLMDTGSETGRIPFSEAALALRPGVDMLINSDFRNPVNQRGLTEYVTSPSAIYSIDKWKRYNSDGLASMILTPEGIQFKASAGATSGFVQILEASSFTTGQIYTLSAFLKVTKGDTIITSPINENIALSYGNSVDSVTESAYLAKAKVVLNEWIVHYITFVLQESVDGVYNFRIRSVAGDVEYCAAAMKLEPGDKPTIAHQDTSGSLVLSDSPPNEALELLKCQRHQIELCSGDNYGIIGTGVPANTNKITMFCPLPVTMRAKPTCVYSHSGNGLALAQASGASGTETLVTNVMVDRLTNNGITIICTASKDLTPGLPYSLWIKNDATTSLLFDANL